LGSPEDDKTTVQFRMLSARYVQTGKAQSKIQESAMKVIASLIAKDVPGKEIPRLMPATEMDISRSTLDFGDQDPGNQPQYYNGRFRVSRHDPRIQYILRESGRVHGTNLHIFPDGQSIQLTRESNDRVEAILGILTGCDPRNPGQYIENHPNIQCMFGILTGFLNTDLIYGPHYMNTQLQWKDGSQVRRSVKIGAATRLAFLTRSLPETCRAFMTKKPELNLFNILSVPLEFEIAHHGDAIEAASRFNPREEMTLQCIPDAGTELPAVILRLRASQWNETDLGSRQSVLRAAGYQVARIAFIDRKYCRHVAIYFDSLEDAKRFIENWNSDSQPQAYRLSGALFVKRETQVGRTAPKFLRKFYGVYENQI